MSGLRDPLRLHDLVDGVLPPREEAELLDRLERDPAARREYDTIRALHTLLRESLDQDPPGDLTLRILAGVREDRARRSRIFRLPGWAENLLVLGGTASLAALVTLGRAVGVSWAVPWLGRLTVGAAEAVEVAKTAAVDTQGSVEHMDWTVRLVTTLSQAGWTALGSSAGVLAAGAGLTLTMGLLTAWILWRQGRLAREGAGHAHLLV